MKEVYEMLPYFVVDIIVTVFLYEIVPIILRFGMKKSYSKKEAKKIAITNTIVVYMLITCYYIFVMEISEVASVYPALLWGTVAFYILKSGKKESNNVYIDNEHEEIENTKLQSLISKLNDEGDKK